jgi:uncharacterized membrane protein
MFDHPNLDDLEQASKERKRASRQNWERLLIPFALVVVALALIVGVAAVASQPSSSLLLIALLLVILVVVCVAGLSLLSLSANSRPPTKFCTAPSKACRNGKYRTP